MFWVRSAGTLSLCGGELSYGLMRALACKGIIIKDKAFHNLEPSELQEYGANIIESSSAFPMFVRGGAARGVSEISNAQFSKLLKQVASHISLGQQVFVQDGSIGTHLKCDAKVRIISDGPTAALTLSSFLWKASRRAISHDPCPLTVYAAGSISSSVGRVTGLVSSSDVGFLAADIERSSLILCGNSFADTACVKNVLSALAAPVILARKGLALDARIVEVDGSTTLLFFLGDTFPYSGNLEDIFVSDTGVVLFSGGASPFFSTEGYTRNTMWKPASVILTVSDSSGVMPCISKLSAGQAAYHFLAGYHDGKFYPSYSKGFSVIPSLELAKALHCYLERNELQSFLINLSHGGKCMEGERFIKLVKTSLSDHMSIGLLSSAVQRVQDLKGKYRSFLSRNFGTLPLEFMF